MNPYLLSLSGVVSICFGILLCSPTLGAHPMIGANSRSFVYCGPILCNAGFDRDFGAINDLSSDPQHANVFWAVTEGSWTNNDIELVRIDLASNDPPERVLLQTIEPIIGLAIDPTHTFYGITASDLVRIDPDTGLVETIGPLGYASELNSWSSIASHPDGTLYGAMLDSAHVSSLVTIDKTTAAHVDLGVFKDIRMQGLEIHPTSLTMHAVGYIEKDYRYLDVDPVEVSATIDLSHRQLGRTTGLAFVESLDAIDCNGDSALSVDDFHCQNPVLLDSFLDGPDTIRGDFDFDGEVGFQDFLKLQSNFGRPIGGRGQLSYVEGDMNLDRFVRFDDFLEFAANFGNRLETEAVPVPEPSHLGLWLIAVLVAVRVLDQRTPAAASTSRRTPIAMIGSGYGSLFQVLDVNVPNFAC